MAMGKGQKMFDKRVQVIFDMMLLYNTFTLCLKKIKILQKNSHFDLIEKLGCTFKVRELCNHNKLKFVPLGTFIPVN